MNMCNVGEMFGVWRWNNDRENVIGMWPDCDRVEVADMYGEFAVAHPHDFIEELGQQWTDSGDPALKMLYDAARAYAYADAVLNGEKPPIDARVDVGDGYELITSSDYLGRAYVSIYNGKECQDLVIAMPPGMCKRSTVDNTSFTVAVYSDGPDCDPEFFTIEREI